VGGSWSAGQIARESIDAGIRTNASTTNPTVWVSLHLARTTTQQLLVRRMRQNERSMNSFEVKGVKVTQEIDGSTSRSVALP